MQKKQSWIAKSLVLGYVKTKGAPRTKFELTEVDAGNSFVEKLKLPFWSSLDLKRRVVIVDSNTVAFTHEVALN